MDHEDGRHDSFGNWNGTDNCHGDGNRGRKGVAYDWHGLYAATQATDLDGEWARLAAAVAESQ